jgi:hypothetical protein
MLCTQLCEFSAGEIAGQSCPATDIEIRHGSFFLGMLDSGIRCNTSSGAVTRRDHSDVDNMRLASDRRQRDSPSRARRIVSWKIRLVTEAIQALQSWEQGCRIL